MPRLIPGLPVRYDGHDCIILDLPSLDRVLIRHAESGKTEQVSPHLLSDATDRPPAKHPHFLTVPDDKWQQAWQRHEWIRPLLSRPSRDRTLDEVRQIAEVAGVTPSTIYRWIKLVEETGTVSSLLRAPRNDARKSRLTPEQDELIQATIEEFYLVMERPSVVETWEELKLRCLDRGISAPHLSTVRGRILQLSEHLRTSRRHGVKAARYTLEPLRGSFPGATHPLAVYQIDHTPADIILVDDINRDPIGRPTLTLVIDVCTRLIAGFYLSLDPAGALPTGLALANAILPKEALLATLGIASTWPIWGLPQKIHADNAKEFRGSMLERACQEYGIIIENRPKGMPQYGGHIERSFRSFMQRTHRVSGTTFSNVQDKGEYNAEGKAILTLSEFNAWFTTFIVMYYHHKAHNGLDKVPPIRLYEKMILGSAEQPGIGLPERIRNEEKLRLDFTPHVERTVQEYGIVIDGIEYYSDVLRPWIHARDPANAKLKRKFIFARDPRDISQVYFQHPDTRQYAPVPYRNAAHPPMSLWELRAVLRRLAEDPGLQVDEAHIFEGLRKLREIEQQALAKTTQAKQAKRQRARRAGWQKAAKPGAPIPALPVDDYPDDLANVPLFPIKESL